eukprot:COSAG01_NODE_32099_length_586_cov_1.215606_1_plen_147_part_00
MKRCERAGAGEGKARPPLTLALPYRSGPRCTRRGAARAPPAPPDRRSCVAYGAQLAMVCATLGNLLGDEALHDLFDELDTDGDGTVSRTEFQAWWEADVAPNQAINLRNAKLEEVAAEAVRKPSLVETLSLSLSLSRAHPLLLLQR